VSGGGRFDPTRQQFVALSPEEAREIRGSSTAVLAREVLLRELAAEVLSAHRTAASERTRADAAEDERDAVLGLVAADAVRAAVAAERGRCAAVCREAAARYRYGACGCEECEGRSDGARECAEAIERGEGASR
jgi:hypothetical protein